MADPVAAVEKIFRIGLAIKDAVDTVRHNEEDCNEIRRRVLRFSAVLSQLQQRGIMHDSPAMVGALEDLEETLQHALELRPLSAASVTAGELSKKLRRVKDDILNKVMRSFAIHAHTTIVLLTIQAGGGGHPLPLQLQPEDERAADTSDNSHSADDPRSEMNGGENAVLTGSDPSSTPSSVALRNFSPSELKNAIKGGYLIGKAPEYLAEGILSAKNDVHGLGVILLEIIGSMYRSKPPSKDTDDFRSSPGVREAWRAWEAGMIEELFDPLLFDGSQRVEMNRCMQIGLLCTQHDRADRPTMEGVLEMLHGEKELPTPKRPAYIQSFVEEQTVEEMPGRHVPLSA
ncbi:hypothetical protein U9M48_038878, partial [Paspalum notatum var. saurae]